MSGEASYQLAAWDPYDQNASAPFFDPEWMYGVMKGFHVVIGNPPYLGGREWKKENKRLFDYYLNEYDVAEYQFDMYVLFWERGIRLARDTGVVTYITPNTWLNNKSTGRLRRYVLKTARVLAIADYSREVVFDAGIVLPIVTILQRPLTSGHDAIVLVPDNGGLRESSRIRQSAWAEDPDAIINLDISETDILLRAKIARDAVPVSDLATVKFGIKLYETGKGDPPQEPAAARDHVFEASTRKDATYRRYLEGKDVTRFALKWQNRWLKYGKNLAAPRRPELFDETRLLFRRIVGERLIGTFTDSDYVTSQLLQIVKPHDASTAKILLGILNSTLMAYYFRKRYNRQDKTFPEIRIYELAKLPMKRRAFSPTKRWPKIGALEALVIRIIEARKRNNNADVSAEDSALDALVYELYELTAAEIAIVEGKSV
jgi:hypothetical protein